MTTTLPLGLGVVGAGQFATFLTDSVSDLPEVTVRSVADDEVRAASTMAARYGALVFDDWRDLLEDPRVDAVVVATPPQAHATIARAALEAGRHVFCEKPLATDEDDLRLLDESAATSDRVLVVDHVLRYNPLLAALSLLQDELLGQPQRFLFENDASDEDLPDGHWFWDEKQSGGIFVEHGVHFFDAATMLLRRPASSVQASSSHRSSGPVDTVSATVRHGDQALAVHTHAFTHARRCERQLMRLDYGTAEARVDGWIPVDAAVDLWTDDAGVETCESLPSRTDELMAVPGYRLQSLATLRVSVDRHAAPPTARGRGADLDVPHHVHLHLTLGGPEAKTQVYAESVRAAMADLVRCAASATRPRSGFAEGAAAVTLALAATAASRLQTSVDLPKEPS